MSVYLPTPSRRSSRVDLFWADPIGGASNDYDLYILNAAGNTVVDSSTNWQNGNDDPWEETGVFWAGGSNAGGILVS